MKVLGVHLPCHLNPNSSRGLVRHMMGGRIRSDGKDLRQCVEFSDRKKAIVILLE